MMNGRNEWLVGGCWDEWDEWQVGYHFFFLLSSSLLLRLQKSSFRRTLISSGKKALGLSSKQGWLSACLRGMRFSGSQHSIRPSRSRQWREAWGKMSGSLFLRKMLLFQADLRKSRLSSSKNSGQSSLVGQPMVQQMSWNWWTSELPCRRGTPCLRNSAMMQPMDQVSTDSPQSLTLMRSSGARYQRVTTLRVRGRQGFSIRLTQELPNQRASPKSAILRMPSLLMRRLVSLRSRWMTYLEWAQLIQCCWEAYPFDQLQGEALDLPLAERSLVNHHLVHQFVEVDVAVFEHQEDAFGLEADHHVLEADDVGVAAQHLEDLDFAEGGHGEAVLVVQHLHLLDGELLVGVAVPGQEDDAVGALPDDVPLLELPNVPTIQRVHLIITEILTAILTSQTKQCTIRHLTPPHIALHHPTSPYIILRLSLTSQENITSPITTKDQQSNNCHSYHTLSTCTFFAFTSLSVYTSSLAFTSYNIYAVS